MIHRQLLMATAIIAFGVITACSDTTAPKSVAAGLPAATNSQQGDQDPSGPQSGALHVTKECTQYTGLAGGFCTIPSSNLNTIKVGTRVVYASGVGPTGLDPDVLLAPPNRGQRSGFG